MKKITKNRGIGFYIIFLTLIMGCISAIRFIIWGSAHNSMDMVIVASLVISIILDIVLIIKDNDYLVIVSTIGYSIAAIKLLVNSVGSFVDAFQGIKMFGDATQVGIIISIATGIGISVLLSIVSGFTKRMKDE